MTQNNNPKKKVVRIIARLNIGGPAIHTILLTKWLNEEKFESVLVTGSLGDGEGDMSYLAEQSNVLPVTIPELARTINWSDDFAALKQIYNILCEEKPDILHTHTAKAGTLGRIACIFYNVVNRIRSKPGCTLIHTFHGHVFHDYFGKLKTTVFISIEKILALFTSVIVVISKRQKEEIGRVLKIKDLTKLKVIPLGFDLTPFLNCEKNKKSFKKGLKKGNGVTIREDTVLIGIVGRLVPIKNHKLFIDAASIVSKEIDNLMFIIIGDGELKERLIKYSQGLEMDGKIVFSGWKKDVAEVYDSLDIVALTSFNEGTPVSLIEAMASRKPVIATEVGGVEDLFLSYDDSFKNTGLRYAENGILVKQDDKVSFAEGLKKLISEKETRDTMGKKGQKFVKERFSYNRLISDIESLYESLS